MVCYSSTSSISSRWIHSLLVAIHLITFRPAHASCNIDPTVRLVGGTVPSEGRLEVFYNGTWGTVCDDYFSITDGEVVCRQLNYVGVKSVDTMGTFGSGDGPIWLDDVTCTGTEPSIQDCNHRGFGVHNCDHTEDIGIVCDPCSFTGKEEEGALRLRGGDCHSNGRVEILHNGEWGTVCVRSWDIDDATVVCRQLGFQRALSAPLRSHYGGAVAVVPTWLSNVQCSGRESRLDECDHNGWGVTSCYHLIEDASVECEDNTSNSTTAPNTPPLPNNSCLYTSTTSYNSAPSTIIISPSRTVFPPSASQDVKLPMSSNLPVDPTSVDTNYSQRSHQLILAIGVVFGILFLGSAAMFVLVFILLYFRRNSRGKSVEDLHQVFSSSTVVGLESQSEVVLTNSSIQLMAHA